MIVVEQVKLPIGHSMEDIKKALCKKLGSKPGDLPGFRIIKRSVDARRKPDIFYVYNIKVDLELKKLSKRADKKHISEYKEESYAFPYSDISEISEESRPVIVGFGPAGMFAGLELARAGLRPVILERGSRVEKRCQDVENFWKTGKLDPESNVQFGEGGAGTFSDGKLNTNTGSRGGRSCEVLKVFAEHGAPENILYDNKPHIGTDILTGIVRNIREEIKSLGGDVHFDSRFEEIVSSSDRAEGLIYTDLVSGCRHEIKTSAVCMAIGHSARDTFVRLHQSNISMESKAFAVGIRIEHPQTLIDRYMYGEENAERREELGLPAADYKLTARTEEGRSVYSFCMCPGGYVVDSSSEEGMLAVNGMSYHKRDSTNANSAIIVNVSQDDFGYGIFDGMDFQKRLEKAAYISGKGRIPVQLLADFRSGRVTDSFGSVKPQIRGDYSFADLNKVLPDYVCRAIKESMPVFDRRISGFNMDDAVCLGVESRTSSPIRIMRDEDLMSSVRGVFPCGEGAGYAGGITSAAADGIKVAEAMAKWILG